MQFERFEKLKLIDSLQTMIRGYKNIATETKDAGFKIEMLHEVDVCEVLIEKIGGEL